MFIWGPVNKDKSLIIPTKVQSIPDKVIDCSIGKYTYSAVDERQMVWIWGENKQAQLGLSDYTQRATPYPLLSLKERAVDSIHFGQNYAIAISKYPKTQEGVSNFLVTTPQNESSQLNLCSSDPKLLQTPLFNQMSRQYANHSNPISSPSPQPASTFLQNQQLLTEQNEFNQREQHM
jgi:alpha-tubulin suppressor-like RCC1 family protein